MRCVGSAGAEKLLVADNLSDDVLLLDAASGEIEKRFDLAESDAVPSTYPVALAVSADGARAFVALWNASEIVELDLAKGTVGRKLALLKPSSPVAPGTHPCALEFSPDGKTLYVALANRDAVAAVECGAQASSPSRATSTPACRGQSYFGAEPVALAVNADGSRLYVANMASDAVAVIDTKKLTQGRRRQGNGRAARLCAHRVDADLDGLFHRRQALRGHRQGQGNRPQQLPADDDGRDLQRRSKLQEANDLHRHAAVRLAGHARRRGDRAESAAMDRRSCSNPIA